MCLFKLCTTWFSCCCGIKTLFVQLCEMFKGINSKQSSGFWVFLCHPPSSSTSSRWGMLWGINIWGRMKWTDLGSLNTLPKMFWGAPCTCNCKVLQRLLRAVLLWQTLGLVTFQSTSVHFFFKFLFFISILFYFAVTLWFAQCAGHTLPRQHYIFL